MGWRIFCFVCFFIGGIAWANDSRVKIIHGSLGEYEAPELLCIQETCVMVHYEEWSPNMENAAQVHSPWFALATATLLGGYQILGVAGPCMPYWQCSYLFHRAFIDLKNTAYSFIANDRWTEERILGPKW